VAGCSDTRETLSVTCDLLGPSALFLRWTQNLPPSVGNSSPGSIDLSKATKLAQMVFWPLTLSVGWITMALETVTLSHRDLREISIQLPPKFSFPGADVGQNIGELVRGQWLDLDRILVQLW